MTRVLPGHAHWDNGGPRQLSLPVVREWLGESGIPDSLHRARLPWENGYIESFKGKLKGHMLDRELFYTVLEVSVLAKRYRRTYNRVRSHSSVS